MHRHVLRLWIVTLAALPLALGGCVGLGGRTEPTRFYVLSSLSPSDGRTAVERGPALGVGPVELPAHLDRPQIVSRATPNRLDLADFDQWAEPLEDGVTRVLAENLSILLSTDRIQVYPWSRSTPVDHQVGVEVIRFDLGADGNVSLTARWTLLGRGGGRILSMRKSSFSEPAGGGTPEETVSAMSRALARLSREIAAAVPE